MFATLLLVNMGLLKPELLKQGLGKKWENVTFEAGNKDVGGWEGGGLREAAASWVPAQSVSSELSPSGIPFASPISTGHGIIKRCPVGQSHNSEVFLFLHI